LRNPRTEALKPMTSMATTKNIPLRRWMVPPFLAISATAPRRIARPPAAMWMGKITSCMSGPCLRGGLLPNFTLVTNRAAAERTPPLDAHSLDQQPHREGHFADEDGNAHDHERGTGEPWRE